ncbi:MAG: hypothetical protein JSW38_06320, partial [Dehalococcoidia bacterium]
EFRPQIIMRNGGSDPHFSDGLTNLGLPVAGFRLIGDTVRALSEVCQGKVIDLIASGYNRQVLPYAWLALISGLADFPITINEPEEIPQRFRQDPALEATKAVVEEVKTNIKDYWGCLR